MKKKKAFTLIELLVVVAIIALLVSILMPALGRAREMAKQLQCAAGLSGIGKAIALYQNTYQGINPTVINLDGATSSYGNLGYLPFKVNYPLTQGRWRNGSADLPSAQFTTTYAIPPGGYKQAPGDTGNTVGMCLWLLIKYEELVPDVFLCPSAEERQEMVLAAAINGDGPDNTIVGAQYITTAKPVALKTWADFLDFQSLRNLGYSYNDPRNLLDSSANPSLVLLADKNPAFYNPARTAVGTTAASRDIDCYNGDMNFWYTNGTNATLKSTPRPDPCTTPANYPSGANWTDHDGKKDTATGGPQYPYYGNSPNHKTECQNVLFVDGHVTKYTKPNVGVSNDNIYTWWGYCAPYPSNPNSNPPGICFKEVGRVYTLSQQQGMASDFGFKMPTYSTGDDTCLCN
jgi:prepilin-type N-terminal cleavage/methylation domain-containing protein